MVAAIYSSMSAYATWWQHYSNIINRCQSVQHSATEMGADWVYHVSYHGYDHTIFNISVAFTSLNDRVVITVWDSYPPKSMGFCDCLATL